MIGEIEKNINMVRVSPLLWRVDIYLGFRYYE